MDVRTLEMLKENYPTASWALWSSEFPADGCIEEKPEEFFEFVTHNRDQLRPCIVLLSLNPSTHLPTDFQNFHSTDPKHRNNQFRSLVEETGLEGAYMTDLVERVIESDSANVEPTSADVDNFLEQLKLLDQKTYYIVCFLSKVFKTLADSFSSTPRKFPHEIKGFTTTQNGLQLECYRVWFHANWGANRDKVPALREQLQFLNAEIIGKEQTNLSRWFN